MEESVIKLETNRTELNDDELILVVEDYREKAREAYMEHDFDTATVSLNIANVMANQLGYMKALTFKDFI